MANVKFGRIEKTEKGTGNGKWGWSGNEETEEMRSERLLAESLETAHNLKWEKKKQEEKMQ